MLALGTHLGPAVAAGPGETGDAVARLNQAGYSRKRHCTAVAVAPRVVLTAAHCLAGAPADEFHILFGYARMDWEASGTIGAVRPLGGDLAALCLGEAAPATLGIGPAAGAGDTVRIVGYGRPRVHLQHARDCRVLGTGGGEMLLDCGATEGDSGGPVLDGAGRVVGILSRASPERAIAVAVPAGTAEVCGQ